MWYQSKDKGKLTGKRKFAVKASNILLWGLRINKPGVHYKIVVEGTVDEFGRPKLKALTRKKLI